MSSVVAASKALGADRCCHGLHAARGPRLDPPADARSGRGECIAWQKQGPQAGPSFCMPCEHRPDKAHPCPARMAVCDRRGMSVGAGTTLGLVLGCSLLSLVVGATAALLYHWRQAKFERKRQLKRDQVRRPAGP